MTTLLLTASTRQDNSFNTNNKKDYNDNDDNGDSFSQQDWQSVLPQDKSSSNILFSLIESTTDKSTNTNATDTDTFTNITDTNNKNNDL